VIQPSVANNDRYHDRVLGLNQSRLLDWTLSPREALQRWPEGRPVCLLHSGRYHENWSRYSILAEPVGAYEFKDSESQWIGDPPSEPHDFKHDPIRDWSRAVTIGQDLWVGALGYGLARHIEQLPNGPEDDREAGRPWPTVHMQRCPGWLIHDGKDGSWHACGSWSSDTAGEIFELQDIASDEGSKSDSTKTLTHPGQASHRRMVEQALSYIGQGDIFQVNLAQRHHADWQGRPRQLFDRLAATSPAWYGCYLERLTDHGPPNQFVCGTSPELFLKLSPDGEVTTRPIKGTLPRSTDAHQDSNALQQLKNSVKDAAELNMIIDLMRNDLGRVCDYGSVQITQSRSIESHPTVHHGVATIRGQLHRSRNLSHLIRATFPGGSITGAPKVRAMQIIDELEHVPRGLYCGAMGYVLPGEVGARPEMQLNIAIRTLVADTQVGKVQFSVGGGIVADSDPDCEYQETLDKAAAMRAALGQLYE
jgi:para-aminobenzoate synthetase component 1